MVDVAPTADMSRILHLELLIRDTRIRLRWESDGFQIQRGDFFWSRFAEP